MIVEDDKIIRQELKKQLEMWGYEIVLVEDFYQIMENFRQVDPHLILLDINLPSFNGYHWCQEIRKESQVPILFISSRSDNLDQIMAMQMGGDDFVQKPFDIPVLIAKIQAILRRTYDFANQMSEVYTIEANKLDLRQATLSNLEGRVELTQTEMLILHSLFSHPNQFVSRDELIEACWQGDHYIDENTLSVNISRLRKKMRQIGLDSFLETKKNVGYRLVEGER